MSLIIRITFLFSTIYCSTVVSGARILAYFPVPAPSHHFFAQKFLAELGRRGHQIDYYSPYSMSSPQENVTFIQLENFMADVSAEMSLYDHWKMSTLEQQSSFLEAEIWTSRKMCQTDAVIQLLSSNFTYDLLIHEGLFFGDVGNIFQHKFNVTSVSLSALSDFFHVNEFSGLVNNPSYMVNAFTVHTDRMGFLERLHNFYLYAMTLYIYYQSVRIKQKMVDECYTYPGWETRPPLAELISDQALILVNSHHIVGFPFPRPPHHKEIGGAILSTRKPLPTDIDEFIREAPHGVIYFSLGSLCDLSKTLPELNIVFSKVFSRRKERVLWKLEGKPNFNLPSNSKEAQWFPQQDILAHKNVKLFITHGGLQSSFEAVNFGVPIIGIPCFADQMKNIKALAQLGFGVEMNLKNISESSLDWALQEALKPEYKERILKGSNVLKDRHMQPVEEAVYWIEYVMRHGKVLQSSGARLGFIQLHSLDVCAFVIPLVFAAACVIKCIANYLFQTSFIKSA